MQERTEKINDYFNVIYFLFFLAQKAIVDGPLRPAVRYLEYMEHHYASGMQPNASAVFTDDEM
jgi:hypothetical protein